MTRISTKALMLVIAVLCLMTQPAYASVHFNGQVQFTTSSTPLSTVTTSSLPPGTVLTATGKIAGLGNTDVTMTLYARGTGKATCVDQDGHKVTGANSIPVSVQSKPYTITKNGSSRFTLTTQPPKVPSSSAAGCPGNDDDRTAKGWKGNWKVVDLSVTFTDATISVTSAKGGDILLKGHFDLRCKKYGTAPNHRCGDDHTSYTFG